MTRHNMSKQSKDGVISKFSDDAGVAYVIDEKINRQFIFGYDKINGYSGQTAKEISLNPGRHVHFTLVDDIVESVDLL